MNRTAGTIPPGGFRRRAVSFIAVRKLRKLWSDFWSVQGFGVNPRKLTVLRLS